MTFVSLIKVGDKEIGHGHPSIHKEIQIEGKNNNFYLFIYLFINMAPINTIYWPLVPSKLLSPVHLN
jgi:hypothetical protein